MFRRHEFIPDFTLPDTNGQPTRFFGGAGGQISLLVFADGDPSGALAALAELAAAHDVRLFVVYEETPATAASAATAFVDAGGGLRKRWELDVGPCAFLLSENLRVIDLFSGTDPQQWPSEIAATLAALPKKQTAHAPVLLIPNVFESDFCDHLISVMESGDNQATAVELTQSGKRATAIDRDFKRRRDHIINDENLSAEIMRRLGRCVSPEVTKAFSFRPTHFEGFKIGCYEEHNRGFFKPHRDNLSPATAHRRFALSVNLNDGYTGGQLQFPEYGEARFRPGAGGAIVFSGSMLHEALEVTEGRRFVLLSFMYGAQDKRRSRQR